MKQKTPLMKLIEWIDNYDDVVYPNVMDIKAKATELLAEEREAMLQSYIQGYIERDDPDSGYYFTQTYGGGDE